MDFTITNLVKCKIEPISLPDILDLHNYFVHGHPVETDTSQTIDLVTLGLDHPTMPAYGISDKSPLRLRILHGVDVGKIGTNVVFCLGLARDILNPPNGNQVGIDPIIGSHHRHTDQNQCNDRLQQSETSLRTKTHNLIYTLFTGKSAFFLSLLERMDRADMAQGSLGYPVIIGPLVVFQGLFQVRRGGEDSGPVPSG